MTMATEKKETNGTTKATRTRSANKPKSQGRLIGDAIDMFEAMPTDIRSKVLAMLNAQYPTTFASSIVSRQLADLPAES
jgi:hypothetical protein